MGERVITSSTNERLFQVVGLHAGDGNSVDRAGTVADDSRQQEDWSSKALREVEVFAKGLVTGFDKGAHEATQDGWHTAANVVMSLGIGAALAYAQRGPGVVKLVAKIAGLEMSTAFALDLLNKNRLECVRGIVIDTWIHKEHTAANIAATSDVLGRYVFDSTLMMAGGMLGSISVSALRCVRTARLERTLLESPFLSLSGEHLGPATLDPLYARAGDSVVQIQNNTNLKRVRERGQRWFCLGDPESHKMTFRGSGFLVGSEGRVVTAWHVVSDAVTIDVGFPNGRTSQARVLRSNPDADLALLQLESSLATETSHGLELADPHSVKTNAQVVGFGYPGGENLLTAAHGYVQALHKLKTICPDRVLGLPVQKPVAVPTFRLPVKGGYSGGPILDKNGKVISVFASADNANASTLDGPQPAALWHLLNEG